MSPASVPCAFCSRYTCACGQPAEWLVSDRPGRLGPWGGFARAPGSVVVDALCPACLERRRRPWWPEEGTLFEIANQKEIAHAYRRTI